MTAREVRRRAIVTTLFVVFVVLMSGAGIAWALQGDWADARQAWAFPSALVVGWIVKGWAS